MNTRRLDPIKPAVIARSILALALLAAMLSGMAIPRVAAQSAPTASTAAATGVSTTEATLNGTVNANGYSATATFEYGVTTAYGMTIAAEQSPVSGATNTAVSATIVELLPGITYHYRVMAENAYGTTYGADMTLTTSPLPPAAITGDATAVTTSGATLNATVFANGSSTTVTFEYGLDTGYGTTVSAVQSPVNSPSPVPVSAAISGLTSNTVYHYRVVAQNANGTTYGADVTFYAGTPIPPTATTAAASNVSVSAATLHGVVNANGSRATAMFEYGLDVGYGTTLMADQNPVDGTADTAVSVSLSDLLPNTTYHYRVVAQNAGGTTSGADMSLTTGDLAVPAATTGAVSSVTTSGATLNGTVNAGGDSAAALFEYGLDASYGITVTAEQSPVGGMEDTAVSKAIGGLLPGTTYYYRVVARNAGHTSYGAGQTFATGSSVSSADTGEATDVTAHSAVLHGLVNAAGPARAVLFEYGLTTSYERAVQAEQSPVSGSADIAVSADISGLIPGTTYYYRVVAQGAEGALYGIDRSFSTSDLPTAVTNAASDVTTSGATLNGTVNARGASTTVTFEYGLDANYGTTVTAEQSPVSGTSDAAVSRTIAGMTNHTTYHYRVVAQNVNGTTYGADMTLTTGDPTAPTATTDAASFVLYNAATLNGTVNPNNATTTVTFEYGLTTGYGTSVTADQSPLGGTSDTAVSVAIAGLANNQTYHYRVVAQNAHGTTNGADMTFITSLAPVVVTGAATAVDAFGATLNGVANANSWNISVFFDYGLTAAYGTTVAATPASIAGNTNTAVSATISGLLPNATYHYRLRAAGFFTTNGADMTFATGPAPTAVTNAATGVSGEAATLNGTVNAAGASAAVTFEYGLDTSYGRTTTADQSPVDGMGDTAASALLPGLMGNTTYHYRVTLQNVLGTVYGADMTFTTGALAPTAVTESASSLTTTGAILNGKVNARNDSATVTFEYGLDTAYGTTTAAEPGTVSGLADTAVSKAIASLLPNITYHYRVVAQNGGGTTYGADRTFYTGEPAAATVTTMAASDVRASTATLHGLANAHGNSTAVFFEFGLDATYGRAVATQDSPVVGMMDTTVSATLSNLLNHTTYHYRVVAQNAYGTLTGADVTFTTGVLPGAVTGAASDVLAAMATLNGTANAETNSTTVSFEYGLDAGYGITVTAEPGVLTGITDTSVSRTITSLLPSTTYHYRVVAQNVNGTTWGADSTLTTGAFPTAVTGAASGVTAFAAILDGTVNAKGTSATVFFEYGLNAGYGITVTAEPGAADGNADVAVSRAISGLLPSTTYHYRVVVQNVNGTFHGADGTFLTHDARIHLPLAFKGHVSGPDLVVQRIEVVDRDVQVVIANVGSMPAVPDFWVDLYVNPATPPTGVNQTWQTRGCQQGIGWGVTQDLIPGETLTLTLSSPYLDVPHTRFDGVAAGDVLYVQVDSAAVGSSYGAVLETHEVTGGAYNNIASYTAVTSSRAAAPAVSDTPVYRGDLAERP